MQVCVIGAGPSGLTTIKQLRDEGHSVVCFEKNEDLGGIWYRKADSTKDAEEMKVFDNLILTISMKLMGYSDFMVEGERVFYTHKQYFDYLKAYATKYGLNNFIKFKSAVKEVRKIENNKWLVNVDIDGKHEEYTFDAVAVCSGPFQSPTFKSVPNLDDFSGEVVHSSKYRNNTQFIGKRVLIIGLAESGADITREISNVASEATLSITSYSFLLPRAWSGKYSTDTATKRFDHYEMFVRAQKIRFPMNSLFGTNWFSKIAFMTFAWGYGLIDYFSRIFSKKEVEKEPENNPLGQPLYPLKLDIDCEWTKENTDAINEWNRRSHKGASNWSQQIIYSKNVSFIQNIVNGKLALNDSGIKSISGNKVSFKDNEIKEFDTIVLCTGFEQNFSILGKDLSVKDNNVRNLYKHAFHPDHAGRLAYIGFVRPYSGGIPIVAEMQARYFAQICSGKLALPANLKQVIEQEKAWEEEIVCLSPKHPETIPSQVLFIDSMAKELGCLPPLSKLIFNPRLFIRLWFYPLNQACYRLIGPHSMYDSSLKEILDDKEGDPSHFKQRLRHFGLLMLPYFIHPKYIKFEPGIDRNLKSNTSHKLLPEHADKKFCE